VAGIGGDGLAAPAIGARVCALASGCTCAEAGAARVRALTAEADRTTARRSKACRPGACCAPCAVIVFALHPALMPSGGDTRSGADKAIGGGATGRGGSAADRMGMDEG